MEKINKEKDILLLIKRLDKLIKKDFDDRLSEFGLTGQQGRILFYISRRVNLDKQEVHQNDIEKEFHLTKSTVSGLVKRLEKNGFIETIKSFPYTIMNPTSKAEQMIDKIHDTRIDAINILLKGFKEKEKEQFIKDITRAIENMQGGKEHVEKN